MTIKTPKKLIEVALPLDDINIACGREKSIRHGHPSTLHLWWARRPLAAARAVIFAQMVNDPGFERHLQRGINKKDAQVERERLFGIIRKLVLWENTNNEAVLAEARAEIWKSWRETCELNRNHPQATELFNPDKLPAFHDPFAGGGAIPLEAQRLGLESYASDLNPVAVLINKAMIEIPPKFAGRAPVGPLPPATGKKDGTREMHDSWTGAKGLAEDVRRYGAWMREEAFKRIGHLYPKVQLPKEHGGGEATVIAWLWARTVKSPNPAFSHVEVPLASTFILFNKAGKETYVQPVIDGDGYRFEVRTGKPPESATNGTKLSRGANFRCLLSDSPIEPKYIYAEGIAGRLGTRLMAIVAEGARGRVYLTPNPEIEAIAAQAKPDWKPDVAMPKNPRWFSPPAYGMLNFGDLFTPRQLVALTTFSDLVLEARAHVKVDALASGMADDNYGLEQGGVGAAAYADAVAVYLACALGKVANIGSTVASWMNDRGAFRETFARQAIQMTWDYAEANPFADAGGSFATAIDKGVMAIAALPADGQGTVIQANASTQEITTGKLVSTDPPYYDNIGYADLSDFFYVWLRRALRPVYPNLFATMAVPKAEELVATPYHHGSKEKAEAFFLDGMTEAMHRLAEQAHPAFPITIYYAFKQSDTTDVGTGNTGWETFLEAVIRAGLGINGTWPMRTEGSGRLIAKGNNALASSIILVCRQRDANALSISRRDFLRELKEQLAEAVEVMIGGAEGISPVAPVDLAQAVIGPGMAIFSKYSAVLEADGSPMSVHTALTLINRMLTEGGDDFDADTQFCLGWFDEMGWAAGDFGQADVLARAKGTSVDGVREAGVVEAGSGKVRLLKPAEYPADWNPEEDNRTPVWEALHQMIRALQSQSETAAGVLLARMPERAEPIRSLAYRLYTLCERKGWAEEARGYNELITSWLGIEAASHETGHLGSQAKMDI
jgi:putative DNA methylase